MGAFVVPMCARLGKIRQYQNRSKSLDSIFSALSGMAHDETSLPYRAACQNQPGRSSASQP